MRVTPFFLLALTFLSTPGTARAHTADCAVLGIDGVGHSRLADLQAGLDLWLELDDRLLACDAPERLAAARQSVSAWGRDLGPYWTDVPVDRLWIARSSHPGRGDAAPEPGVRRLLRGGPFQVLTADDEASARSWAEAGESAHDDIPGDEADGGDGCLRPTVLPVTGSTILARQSANAAPRSPTSFGSAAAEAAAAVDGARWMADVTTLAGWNRHTHGAQIAQARDWLVDQMSSIGLATTTEAFSVGGTTAYNVIGRLDGTTRPDDWFLVGAHYDATSQNVSQAAPGAEDNASGCAGVLELARVLVPRAPEATFFFLCYSGEEQGLHGSEDHASDLVAAGHGPKIQRVLTMDMIGYTGDSDLDVLLETEPAFADELDPLVDAAAAFTELRTVTSLFAFGSDHVPYLDRDLPALLTIENDWASYSDYHRTTDTPDNITQAMGAETLRMNAAVLAEEGGAQAGPSSTIFSDGFDDGGLGAWSLSSGS